MPRAEHAGPTDPAAMRNAPHAWWGGVLRLRASPRRFVWLLLWVGVATCLLSGCGTRTDSPFTEKPTPDIAVTTLDEADIDTVAAVSQLQATIQRGCELSLARPLPEPVRLLVQDIADQQVSRARDLAALVLVKHAPLPDGLPRHHEELLAGLARDARTSGKELADDVIAFHRATQTEALRLLRDAADRSQDPDVRAFGQRQTRGVANILARMDDAF